MMPHRLARWADDRHGGQRQDARCSSRVAAAGAIGGGRPTKAAIGVCDEMRGGSPGRAGVVRAAE